MKKVFAIATIGGLFLASCKGDYHCDCTTQGVTTTHYEYHEYKKKDAQSACDTHLSNLQQVDASATCSLVEADH